MTPPDARLWDYRIVALRRAVDADTFDLTLSKTFDFGFYLVEEKQWSSRFRLLGIDAIEANRAGGTAATAFAKGWLDLAIYDDVLRGQTHKTDNFGRWLIDLYRLDTGERLSQALRTAGFEKEN